MKNYYEEGTNPYIDLIFEDVESLDKEIRQAEKELKEAKKEYKKRNEFLKQLYSVKESYNETLFRALDIMNNEDK